MTTTRSVRALGKLIGINKNTALRWRHAILRTSFAFDRPATLRHAVDMTELVLPYSQKGGAPHPSEPVWFSHLAERRTVVLVASDSKADTMTRVAGATRPIPLVVLTILLRGRISPGAVVYCPSGVFSGYSRFCNREGLMFVDSRGRRRLRPESAGRRINRAFVLSLRRFLDAFRGVATCYLTLYLHWHELLRRIDDSGERTFLHPVLA